VKPENKKSRPLFFFYLLVAYVFVQFFWWTYLLVDLNNEVYTLRERLSISEAFDNAEAVKTKAEYESKLSKRRWMIAGEGSVFVLLMVFGIARVRNTFKKESDLNLRQRNFLLSITHELKSPIASAKLQLETILKRDLEKEKQKELLQNALNDTERLNKLVENILLATRIDNRNFELHLESVNLSDFLEEIIEQSKMIFSPSQKIEKIITKGVEAKIDMTAFPSIVINLLENAIKYSLPNALIKIMLIQEQNKVFLRVIDEGSGIPDEEKERVFEKFYRVGNEDVRKTKGTGLGLYIVKYLVLKHNGNISIKNNSPKGSVFEIAF